MDWAGLFRRWGHTAALTSVCILAAGVLAQFASNRPALPEHDSLKLLEGLTEQLQPRPTAPDLAVPGLPHWQGVADVEIR